MATLVWNKAGERIYQTGLDRGVLFLQDGTTVPWNGLTSVEDGSNSELKTFYMEGVPFLQRIAPGDYQGKLKAFTYPDEFDLVNGIAKPSVGFSFYDQPPQSFNLSYRTRIANDLAGADFAYKIHILYNVLANPDAWSSSTFQDSGASPIEFSWSLVGTPPAVENVRPTCHVSIDSRYAPPEILKYIEGLLYGTATSEPNLPSIEEIAEFFGYQGALIVTDNGDGTWTALDLSDTYVTMLDDTQFQIAGAVTTTIDPVTYTLSSTNVGG